jgi:hypothetical protein
MQINAALQADRRKITMERAVPNPRMGRLAAINSKLKCTVHVNALVQVAEQHGPDLPSQNDDNNEGLVKISVSGPGKQSHYRMNQSQLSAFHIIFL